MKNQKLYEIKSKVNGLLTKEYNKEVPSVDRVNSLIKALGKLDRIDTAMNCVMTQYGFLPKTYIYGL